MITQLSGQLIEKQPPELVVDVQGVGYHVMVPMTTYYQLPEAGAPVTIFTHFHVREDAQQLYGFMHKQDRQLFRDLIKVNGIGAKMALAILSGMDAPTVVQSIQTGDVQVLTRIPGIGKKTAERLIIEMRDRLKHWLENFALNGTTGHMEQAAPSLAMNQHYEDALSALIALGYKPQEAKKVLSDCQAVQNSEEMIRAALKKLVKK